MATEQRLIDANALKKAIMAEPWKNQINAVRLVVDYINIIIDEQPTVDARPVVQAEWKPYYDYFTKRQVGWICTNCSGVQDNLSNGDTAYCSHCGAITDGGVNDGN